MSVTYTVVLSDAQNKALGVAALDQASWIQHAIEDRCRHAMDEIISAEVQRLLDAGQPITGSRDDIVMAADVESAAERQARIDAADEARRIEEQAAQQQGA